VSTVCASASALQQQNRPIRRRTVRRVIAALPPLTIESQANAILAGGFRADADQLGD
jgi:hypothetical protein